MNKKQILEGLETARVLYEKGATQEEKRAFDACSSVTYYLLNGSLADEQVQFCVAHLIGNLIRERSLLRSESWMENQRTATPPILSFAPLYITNDGVAHFRLNSVEWAVKFPAQNPA